MTVTTAGAPSSTARLVSVDFLRGTAMIGLVFVHSILYLTPLPEGDDVDVVYVVFVFVLGDVGAALFTTLVGISFVLSMRSRTHLSSGTVIGGAAVRGAFLLIVAMLISLVTVGLDALFEWDVLALIAVASIVLAFLRPLPNWALLAVGAAVVVFAPAVRGAVGYLEYWGGQLIPVDGIDPPGLLVTPAAEFVSGLSLEAAFAGMLAAGFFPLLPWLAFPIIGMVLGRQILDHRRRAARLWVMLGVVSVAVGIGLALTALSRGDSDVVTDHWTVLSFTPASTPLFLVQLGLVLVVLGVTSLILDGRASVGAWMNPIRLVSRYSLTVYTASYLFIFAIVHVADLVDGSRVHVSAVTTTAWAVVSAIAFVLVMIPGLGWWDRHGGVGTLEWTMNHLRVRASATKRAGG